MRKVKSTDTPPVTWHAACIKKSTTTLNAKLKNQRVVVESVKPFREKKMKSWKIAVGAALLVASAAAMAYTPGAGITGTPHDWSATGGTKLLLWLDSKGAQTTFNTGTAYIDPATGKQGISVVTIGQCTKCHTPHQAKSTSLLWNHTLQAITYKWDDPATTAGTAYATFKGDTYNGPTIKGLSCLDGLLSAPMACGSTVR